jgi:hypothetical protein
MRHSGGVWRICMPDKQTRRQETISVHRDRKDCAEIRREILSFFSVNLCVALWPEVFSRQETISVHRDRKDCAEIRREIFELFLGESLCRSVA